jgi:hypothetical protein
MAASDERRFAPFDVIVICKIACVEPGRIDRVGRLDKAAARAVSQKLRGFLR